MKNYLFIALILISIFAASGDPRAQTDIDPALFQVKVPPNALILLDMSGSMNQDPAGNLPPPQGQKSKIAIAKEVLFDILDADDNGIINNEDDKTLNVRLGFMRFLNSVTGAVKSDDGNPMSGTIKVVAEIGTPYTDIWNKISNELAPVGGTPLAESLDEAKTYIVGLDDALARCRAKFVILISDGQDTLACHGTGEDCPPGTTAGQLSGMWRRRLSTLLNTKALSDYTVAGDFFPGIQVFAVGFGEDMPDYLKTTLNWVAYYGKTDNTLEPNSGVPVPGAYDLARFDALPCTTLNPGTFYTNLDPVNHDLSGYAFIASDATELTKALKKILGYIADKTYAFTAPVLPAVRITDSEVAYFSSFSPDNTPYWEGHLKAFKLNSDGTLPIDLTGAPDDELWDAGEILNARAPGTRNIFTVVDGVRKNFKHPDVGHVDLDLQNEVDSKQLIDHIRGFDAFDIDKDGKTDEWREFKLGDIFNSQPVIIGAPSAFFEDMGFSGPGGFYEAKKDRTKVIVAGANDGMLHAFDKDGNEKWAFIPPSVLKSLKKMSLGHTFYVDSTPRVADVWADTIVVDDKKTKEEWRTILVCGLRKGGSTYFALDVTDTLNPIHLWDFPKANDPVTLGKVGQSWSEPAIGRVKVEEGDVLHEKWVAFIGGGYLPGTGLPPDLGGRSFFVIDILTGNILWEFSSGIAGEKAFMKWSLVASPVAVDMNGDGYIDRVYIGDLGGQMWVFDLPYGKVDDWTGKRLFAAPVGLLGKSEHPIYFQAAVAFDKKMAPWVFFGTGNREDPNAILYTDRFYAVLDNRVGGYPYDESALKDVTGINTFSPLSGGNGWFFMLVDALGNALGEKVLSKPSVFNQIVYFTTETPTETTSATCEVVGSAKLYAVYYLTGGGALAVDDNSDLAGGGGSRSKSIGKGIPSSPVITINLKGEASILVGTTSNQISSEPVFAEADFRKILYWREVVPSK